GGVSMLGDKVKQYRKQNHMTMQALAAASGLSTGYISQLERGLVEPSLSSLRKISDVLDIPPFLLLDYKPKELLTMRNENHMIMRNKDDTVVYEFLTPLPTEQFIPKSMILKFSIKPHSSISEHPLTHPSEELVTLFKGQLTMIVGDEETILYPGDSSIIQIDMPHIYRNNCDEPAEGIACFTPPVWGQSGL
ncbi:XRE family transcriptional regulator, partial [Christensenellaceae bacterium OttesenSCG-928-M15]|nr:XRE family transcriptional regulator [Christensenellaceae bacterium OttesenSCG-928-M15]